MERYVDACVEAKLGPLKALLADSAEAAETFATVVDEASAIAHKLAALDESLRRLRDDERAERTIDLPRWPSRRQPPSDGSPTTLRTKVVN